MIRRFRIWLARLNWQAAKDRHEELKLTAQAYLEAGAPTVAKALFSEAAKSAAVVSDLRMKLWHLEQGR